MVRDNPKICWLISAWQWEGGGGVRGGGGWIWLSEARLLVAARCIFETIRVVGWTPILDGNTKYWVRNLLKKILLIDGHAPLQIRPQCCQRLFHPVVVPQPHLSNKPCQKQSDKVLYDWTHQMMKAWVMLKSHLLLQIWPLGNLNPPLKDLCHHAHYQNKHTSSNTSAENIMPGDAMFCCRSIP